MVITVDGVMLFYLRVFGCKVFFDLFKFGAPFFPFYLPLVKETERGAWYLAEDFAFSERERQAGF